MINKCYSSIVKIVIQKLKNIFEFKMGVWLAINKKLANMLTRYCSLVDRHLLLYVFVQTIPAG